MVRLSIESPDFTLPDHRRILRGFALVELVLVMAILAIMAAVAVPRFAASYQRYRLDAAADRVVRDLEMARERARAISATQEILFDAALDRYFVKDMPDPEHPRETYTVRLADPPFEVDLTSADFGGDAKLAFDGYGRPDTGGQVRLTAGTQQRVIDLDGASGSITVTEFTLSSSSK